MKHVSVQILVVAILLIACNSASSQERASLFVEPATQSVPVGGPDVEARIMVDGVLGEDGLGGYTLVMEYDPAVLRAVAITDSGFVGSTQNAVLCPSSAIDNDAGRLGHFCFTLPVLPQPGPLATQPELLVSVTFEPTAEGTTALDISETAIIDPSGNTLASTVENGSVTVGEGPAPGTSDTPATRETIPGGGLPGTGGGSGNGGDLTALYLGLGIAGVVVLAGASVLALLRRRGRV